MAFVDGCFEDVLSDSLEFLGCTPVVDAGIASRNPFSVVVIEAVEIASDVVEEELIVPDISEVFVDFGEVSKCSSIEPIYDLEVLGKII